MRFLIILLIVILINLSFPVTGQAAPGVSANNAILIEQSTGRVLFEKNAHEQANIASITKIMTAIIAVESGKLDEYANATRNAIYTEGSSIYLEQGEKMKLEDLVYGLMLRSGNDAAVAIGEHVGGSLEGFVFMMNEKATWLGMTNTHFDNPHGLDSDTHYSSAYDMAILMKYAMENESFKKISGTVSYKSDNRSYSWQNKNKLLTQFYEYCTGGKTGYTRQTGRTLVSSAEKDGMELIAVTLDAPDDWRDHISMFEWGYENYKMESLTDEGPVKYKLNKDNRTMNGYVKEELSFPLAVNERDNISFKNFLLDYPDLEKEQVIGKTVFYVDDIPLTETTIYSVQLAKADNSFIQQVKSIFKKTLGMKSYD
ncbi:D-alanyl-D-alanine carboxypeptidase family protein [Oceanobacillus saliphilus]|uniref:D-alanyl-D-alanine carboxypeptidase family protein n=1 Tax=Oceanobacillus saliphilus TaxID=2925834 RepID=UPI00201DD1EC|nr:D-alanyl-D-alanine carboxypeptidase family protein [Oceanobacillus saliphilus]